MTTTASAAANGHTGGMNDDDRDVEVPARAKRRQYSARYKLETLAEYEQLDKEGKGALLRRENLYTSLISEWRKQRDRGALEALSATRGRPPADPKDREIERLKAEKDKLAKELDRTRRVVEVQGKLSALLEELATESQPDASERDR
jgi:transposase